MVMAPAQRASLSSLTRGRPAAVACTVGTTEVVVAAVVVRMEVVAMGTGTWVVVATEVTREVERVVEEVGRVVVVVVVVVVRGVVVVVVVVVVRAVVVVVVVVVVLVVVGAGYQSTCPRGSSAI